MFSSVIVKTEPEESRPAPRITTPIPVDIVQSPKVIKIEIKDSADDIDETLPEIHQPIIAPPEIIINPVALSQISPTRAPQPTAPVPITDTKYCHICDIKFNYLNTFIAHKKFYCKTIKQDLDGATSVITSNNSPSPASVVTRPAETSVL